ncbi:MAG TPA: DUF1501 domain-containing protein [Chthonomonadaceae bacterium]|nr:DUF1501 domain-containing protein [Chthonomonadaceae bacterium]
MNIKLSRRQVLTGAALAAAVGAAEGAGRNLSALASVTVGTPTRRTGGNALVVLFLRGGADGLNIVVPYADDDYHRLRPTLGLAGPNDRGTDPKARVLDLDGFFGLHPAPAPLLPLYYAGAFAAVHAVGSGDQTRSHFEAMATMERGLAQDTGAASGWLARHLNATATEHDSPLRAVAVTDTMPDSLRGAISATALSSLADYRLTAPAVLPTGSDGQVYHAPSPAARADALTDSLRGLYGEGNREQKGTGNREQGTGNRAERGEREEGTEGKRQKAQYPTPNTQHPDFLSSAGSETLAALEAVHRLDPAHYRPVPGAVYPNNEIGNGFRQVACLVKGDVGLEIACLDMGGWDTHVAQGRDTGWQPARLSDLGRALAAFAADLGPLLARVTTVVMTEFGRRAYENSGLGTDHGRASCMFLLGGGVHGGRVFAQWPGLAEARLEGPGDLHVTTDYRDILAEILAHRLHNPHLADVFPEYTPRFHNLVRG